VKYITGIPNRGAGIGHAFTDWGKALVLARKYNLQFLHSPFTGNNVRWESVLGLGRFFNPYRQEDFDLLITSEELSFEKFLEWDFGSARTVYVIDGHSDQRASNGVNSYDSIARFLRYSYLRARRNRPFFNPYHAFKIRVALHIRRGNIVEHQEFKSRVLPYEYFSNILSRIRDLAPPDSLDVLVVTNDRSEESIAFAKESGARILDLGSDIQDFDALVKSDILITSNSGFSFLASLINIHSIKIVTEDFWHRWPESSCFANSLDDQASWLSSQISDRVALASRRLNRKIFRSPWSCQPFTVLESTKVRDLLIDNCSRHASIFSHSNGKFSGLSRDDSLFVALSRRYLGAFVNGVTQQIEFDAYDKRNYTVQKKSAAFIDLSALSIDKSLLASLVSFLKLEFNEMLMGRVILLPHSSRMLFNEFSAARFHSSISFVFIPQALVYCRDLIGIRPFSGKISKFA